MALHTMSDALCLWSG